MGETCDNTEMFREDCRCLDCKPEVIDISVLLDGSHNIVDVIDRLRTAADNLEELGLDGSEIGDIVDDSIIIRREKIEGHYWTRCDCGNIVQVLLDRQIVEYCNECKSKPLSLGCKAIFVLVVVYSLTLLVSVISSIFGLFSVFDEPIIIILLIAPVFMIMCFCRIEMYREDQKKRDFYARKRRELQEVDDIDSKIDSEF
ncbi:MAG: hypothetical protein RTU30_05925 [Candidatus Thorarchaeota archaeon]